MTNEQKTRKLIKNKLQEITLLKKEGYMPEKDFNKVCNMCIKLRNEIVKRDFNFQTINRKYAELFISHKFLYHPDHYGDMLDLMKKLNLK